MPKEMYIKTLKDIFVKIQSKVSKKRDKELIGVCKSAIGKWFRLKKVV